jgi:hypothetical protein
MPEDVGRIFAINIEWAPWSRKVELILLESGSVLLTGKAVDLDGVSRTLNLTSSRAVFALFGAGDRLEGEAVIDIRRGWVIANLSAADSEFEHGPSRD